MFTIDLFFIDAKDIKNICLFFNVEIIMKNPILNAKVLNTMILQFFYSILLLLIFNF